MTNPNGGGMRRAGYVLLVMAATAIGVFAGAWWGRSTPQEGDEASHAHDAPKQLWTCSMHPQVIREEPGPCPICHMQLVPLATETEPQKEGGAVVIDPVMVQNMGVRTTEVMRGQVKRTIRAVGYLGEAQPLRYDVNLRVSGWIEKLYADTEGMHVHKGEPLFELYSPQLLVGIEELISAPRESASGKELYGAARRKLELWGLQPQQIDELEKLDTAPRTVTFLSPVDGHVIEKNIVEGAAVNAGDLLLRIVDHSELWLDAQVYAQDLPLVKLGQRVKATVEGYESKEFPGEVIFIHPHVDSMTRTAMVRMAIPNPVMQLRPGMYATVWIETQPTDDVPLVPDEAVIDTGSRKIVFVALGEGKFEPRDVKTGLSSDDGMVQVLEGLAVGETVVVSGQFLLDAESRMREAIRKYLSQNGATSNGQAAPPPAHQH